jgi:hypothetical protein
MNVDATDRNPLDRLGADPVACEICCRRHVDRAMRFTAGRVHDAGDVVDFTAATFVTVLTSASTYEPDRGAPG